MNALKAQALRVDRFIRSLPDGVMRFCAALLIAQAALVCYANLSAGAWWLIVWLVPPSPLALVVYAPLALGFFYLTIVMLCRLFVWPFSVAGSKPSPTEKAAV